MSETRSPVRWALHRLLMAVPVIVGVTTLTFVLIHAAPGDPIYLLAGDGGSPEYYADMRGRYGLDRSLVEQFVRYTRAALSADFGHSFMYQAPVANVIVSHAPASLLLGLTALTIATVVGFGLGTACALAPSRVTDGAVRVFASVGYAAPVFWTGQILIILLSVRLGLLPVGGMSSARESLTGVAYVLDVLRHLLLPAVTLSIPFMAVVARVTRAGLLEIAREPFIGAALARGLSQRRVVLRHASPHAAVAIAALIGQHAGQIVAGAALTETLFAWPGLGYLVLHASLHRDYPLVTGSFILISAGVVLFNAIADAAGAWLDPRLRLT